MARQSDMPEMDGYADDRPTVAFTPRLGRFLLTELWSVALGLGIVVAVVYVFPVPGTEPLAFVAATGIIGVLIRAMFLRRSRRIEIGDTWISGPTRGSSETTLIPFGTIDRARSGMRKGRLRIRSLGGEGISIRTVWYSPADVEDMRRLLRDRCGMDVSVRW